MAIIFFEGSYVRLVSRNKKYDGLVGIVVGKRFDNRWPVKIGKGEKPKIVKVLDKNLISIAEEERSKKKKKIKVKKNTQNLSPNRDILIRARSAGRRRKTENSKRKYMPSSRSEEISSEHFDNFKQKQSASVLTDTGGIAIPQGNMQNKSLNFFSVGARISALSRITKCWYDAKIISRCGGDVKIAWESGDPTDTTKTIHELKRLEDGQDGNLDDELEALREQMAMFTSSMVDYTSHHAEIDFSTQNRV